jgi:hypothetical protein
MFNREEIKPREYKGTTIFLTKYSDVTVEKFLDIIVRSIESYVKQKGIMPEKIRISYENYNRILQHNKSLIEKKEGKYYTFGVEIEV